jgi:hypothetical protein
MIDLSTLPPALGRSLRFISSPLKDGLSRSWPKDERPSRSRPYDEPPPSLS